MSISLMKITINTELFLSGVTQISSDGSCGTGCRLKNHRVRIVKILDNGAKYPILLGDRYDNNLGWVSFDDLTGVTTVNITSVGIP